LLWGLFAHTISRLSAATKPLGDGPLHPCGFVHRDCTFDFHATSSSPVTLRVPFEGQLRHGAVSFYIPRSQPTVAPRSFNLVGRDYRELRVSRFIDSVFPSSRRIHVPCSFDSQTDKYRTVDKQGAIAYGILESVVSIEFPRKFACWFTSAVCCANCIVYIFDCVKSNKHVYPELIEIPMHISNRCTPRRPCDVANVIQMIRSA